MKRPFPLYLKILIWFFLNLLLLAVAGYVVLQGSFGPDLLLSRQVLERVAQVSDAMVSKLRAQPRENWDALLRSGSADYGVKFVLFKNEDGSQLAGPPTVLPPEVKQRLETGFSERRGRDRGPPRPPEERPREGGGPPAAERALREGTNSVSGLEERRFRRSRREGRSASAFPRFVVHTASPTQHWLGLAAPLGEENERVARSATLLVVANTLYGGGLFVDVKPLLMAAVGALLFSILFWFPLVRSITRALAQTTGATEQIAQGRFAVRVRTCRRDEIGQLAEAVNRMAERLQGFVTGQKRFLGDTAHELCTPLARIQVALGILEQRADRTAQAYVADLREEVEHMSGLVNELLSFSKASLAQAELKLRPVRIRPLVEQVVEREAPADPRVMIEVDPELEAVAEPELLERALANLIRNAVRYAGQSGPITVSGKREGGAVRITVADCGLGVPEESLPRLFDPFFRVDHARTRESGGVGLGLTIVKTCAEASGGTVSCRNRQPNGLEVAITLNARSRPEVLQ